MYGAINSGILTVGRFNINGSSVNSFVLVLIGDLIISSLYFDLILFQLGVG